MLHLCIQQGDTEQERGVMFANVMFMSSETRDNYLDVRK